MPNMSMGLGPVLGADDTQFMQKNRWYMSIPGVSENRSGMLPPSKSARPSVGFKETEVEHLMETIAYPTKPQWKPINITLYNVAGKSNLVFDWMKQLYDPCAGVFGFVENFKKEVTLELFNGCGCVLECWKYINAYPSNIEFGELDMGNAEIVTVDLTLRYDRAYECGCYTYGSTTPGISQFPSFGPSQFPGIGSG